ncbi:N-acetyllactosaminide beta-1,3-N-acetylglucosaminyltransferase 2a isoform X1 [Epinephelus fuscoguttatus]|uniref:N-acetyllactosaminide beta-1,3-N-acetylglucosaminyltransferase 2a isoform X1 n=2 Tax=Epinephelus fuscoguttatus TaxID=293821 RepID=UPI0020D0BFC0|nr:N-acetyllactosaminide beta-1,3-N-acetylglucosaminyltransferase 2a isoform X1 [Epinephelus fuscoguttatus]
MFPNVPLYPGFVTQRGGNMPVARKKRVLCVMMMLNIFICVLVGVSWNLGRDKSGHQKVQIPLKRFWHQPVLSKSFWNREQQRLDFIYNPIVNFLLSSDPLIELPDWLNETRPLNPCEPDHRVSTQIPDYNTLPQPFQDFLLHMRCRTYPMLINQPHICDEKPFLLLAVKSLIPHFDRRQAIRETWGRAGIVTNRTVVTVFLLGNTLSVDHFPDMLGMLGHEAKLHNDILQWDYRDSFYNLTLKEVLFLEWFSQNCPHAQYVLKGDDDVFVNTLRIIDLLEGLSDKKAKDLFIGDVISNAGPHRDKKLKYFVPESVFVGRYPPYAGGGGYLYSGELALRLYNVSQQVVLYPIDDVYTGMCLEKLGLVPEDHSGFRTFDIEEKQRTNPCIHRGLILVHSRTPQEMLTIWPWIIHPELNCQ